jgi:hypothetical protein
LISQGAQLACPCGVCGASAVCEVGERIVHGRLQWTISSRCRACGDETEEIGWDDSPAKVRNALLDTHGPVRIRLEPPPEDLASVMKVLRQRGKVAIGEAKAQAQRLAAGELVGTLVEMELLAERLREAGIGAATERIRPTSS